MKTALPLVVLEAFGLRLGVRGFRAGELEELRQRFPVDWNFVPFKPRTLVDHWFGPSPRDAATSGRGSRVEMVGNRMQLYLCEHARTHVLVHAGVVVLNGKCVLLPGKSGIGKSTLVHALVRGGASYMSDEYAVIDDDGFVHSYARPITLKSKVRRRLRRLDPGPFMDPGGSTRLRAAVVLETHYAPRGLFCPVPLSRLELIGLLARHSAAPRHRPGPALTAFSRLTETVQGFSSVRGGPMAVFRWLQSNLA